MIIKPILFNTEMVRAILDGRKTVTRRVAFPNTDLREFKSNKYPFGWWYKGRVFRDWDSFIHNAERPKCKYQPNDILYVRETWNYGYFDSTDKEGSNDTWFEPLRERDGKYLQAISGYVYRADYTEQGEYDFGVADEKGNLMKMPWKPSIHMPKEAARIWLKVTGVRLERLQDMTNSDARKEGCSEEYLDNDDNYVIPERVVFEFLWDSTIKEQNLNRYGWVANPWVWVIEFERCEKPEGE